MRINGQLELDERMRLVDLQLRLCDGVIHAVMDIERGNIRVADTAAADVGLVRQNERRRHRIDRHAGALVVIADGRRDECDLLRLEAHVVENAEGHDRAALAVIDAVDQIADVVEIARDLRQLHHPLRIAQRLQDIACLFRNSSHMRKAVLREAKGAQGSVGLRDIGMDRLVLADLFISHSSSPLASIITGKYAAGKQIFVKST